MAHHLVLVESPNKARKILGIMRNVRSGDKWHVVASFGHLRDLPPSEFGVNIPKLFEPKWVLTGQAKQRKLILDTAKKVDTIWLATDPDAEGEAIAWHLREMIVAAHPKLAADIKRIEFNELTVKAITGAFDAPRPLNGGRVEAAVARRLLDRIVGYSISPLLWRDFNPGETRSNLSAGRVQSAVLEWLTRREEEIRDFKPEPYWKVVVDIETERGDFTRSGEGTFKTKKKTLAHLKALKSHPNPSKVTEGERTLKPPPPFTTSSLMQAASAVYGFTSDRTMKLAQTLFEQGLITYHRTESIRPTWPFVMAARKHLLSIVSEDDLTPKPKSYPATGKYAAHSAIHPTNVQTMSGQVKGRDEAKLYRLIWVRAVVGQLKNATVVDQEFSWLTPHKTGKRHGSLLEALSHRECILKLTIPGVKEGCEGWLKISAGMFDQMHYSGEEGTGIRMHEEIDFDSVTVKKAKAEQRHTEAPRPYTESTVIRQMEDSEVGRPSTYAATLVTLRRRGFIKNWGKTVRVTPRGEMVTAYLRANFPELVRDGFTAGMEKLLDQAEQRKVNRTVILLKYWKWLKPRLRRSKTIVVDTPECPHGHGPLKWILNMKGSPRFECKRRGCKHITNVVVGGQRIVEFKPSPVSGTCTKCGEDELWLRQSAYGTYIKCDSCGEVQRKAA